MKMLFLLPVLLLTAACASLKARSADGGLPPFIVADAAPDGSQNLQKSIFYFKDHKVRMKIEYYTENENIDVIKNVYIYCNGVSKKFEMKDRLYGQFSPIPNFSEPGPEGSHYVSMYLPVSRTEERFQSDSSLRFLCKSTQIKMFYIPSPYGQP
jgi:hypothetical protein